MKMNQRVNPLLFIWLIARKVLVNALFPLFVLCAMLNVMIDFTPINLAQLGTPFELWNFCFDTLVIVIEMTCEWIVGLNNLS